MNIIREASVSIIEPRVVLDVRSIRILEGTSSKSLRRLLAAARVRVSILSIIKIS
jgi:hypothetical protein